MFDVKAIRDDRAVFDRGWRARGLDPLPTDAILEADQTLRAAQAAFQSAQARRNEASKLIGAAKARKDEARAAELMAEVETLKAELTGCRRPRRPRPRRCARRWPPSRTSPPTTCRKAPTSTPTSRCAAGPPA